ncbi:MAG: TetR/AcrR family transcriptional regulator [Acidimicrobiales bacterium]
MTETSTRDRLLRATRACVTDRGVAGTTSRAITSAAGANLAAITYHFGSKDDLVAEALLEGIREAVAPALAVLGRDDLEPPVRVALAVEALRSAFAEASSSAPGYVEALVQGRHLPRLREGMHELFAEIRRFLSDQMTEQQAAGQLPAWVEPEAMAALIVAAANGIVVQSVLEPGGTDANAMAGQFAGLLLSAWTGVRPPG